jgi:hypothetical protein
MLKKKPVCCETTVITIAERNSAFIAATVPVRAIASIVSTRNTAAAAPTAQIRIVKAPAAPLISITSL